MPKKNPSRLNRSRDRLLDRAVFGLSDADRERWARLTDEPIEPLVQERANEREAEDIAILMMAL